MKKRVHPRSRAEVLVVGPADPTDVMFRKLVDMLVEYGIHIESDRNDRLPDKLPRDLARHKAVIADAGLPLPKRLPDNVIRYRKPETFAWHDERPAWLLVSALLTRHGVKPQNPTFLERNASRPDRNVILGQAEACLRNEPDWCRRWCDSTLVRLEGIWAAARLYGRDDLKRAVLDCVDETLKAHEADPARFRHPIFPGLLLPLWKETGRKRYRDAALSSMETPAEAKRIAREWRRGTPFLQCESLDRKPWQWAMRARWCGEPELFQPAVDCMKAGFETLFDDRKNLWAHYGIRGKVRGLAWGRGQGWALYGLVGLLEHLPQSHPDFGTMRSWIGRTARGFRDTQDPVTGMWRNVLDEPSTRLETSGTAKAIRHLARAWRLGLCREDFIPGMLARGWRGLKAHTFDHRSCTRIYGTGPGFDVPFYATLGTGGSYTAAVQAGSEYVAAFGPLVE